MVSGVFHRTARAGAQNVSVMEATVAQAVDATGRIGPASRPAADGL